MELKEIEDFKVFKETKETKELKVLQVQVVVRPFSQEGIRKILAEMT
jgi:cell division GTPase FtsZ